MSRYTLGGHVSNENTDLMYTVCGIFAFVGKMYFKCVADYSDFCSASRELT